MKVETTKFIESSVLFSECERAYDVFSNSDPDCSWGDNNRTLVTVDLIFNSLNDAYIDAYIEEENKTTAAQIKIVLDRIKQQWGDNLQSLPYVDLEN